MLVKVDTKTKTEETRQEQGQQEQEKEAKQVAQEPVKVEEIHQIYSHQKQKLIAQLLDNHHLVLR